MVQSVADFSRQLTDSGVLTGRELEVALDAASTGGLPQDAEQYARLLVKRKLLTAYQAEHIISGRGRALVYGNYLVLDKLGHGGMGVVLKAKHRRMERVVALKVLSPEVSKNSHSIARFQREVRAIAKLNHTNIVHAYDADEVNGRCFLVMEYIDGSDLSAIVKQKGPLTVEKALLCVLQAAQGLNFAHGWGIIHRDVKPSNLLIDRTGTVKLLDLGLARIDATENTLNPELTGTGVIVGTVDYMAPEQAKDIKQADVRSDIYSLGATLWYLLTGRVMYPADSLIAKLIAHQSDPVPSLRTVCPGVSPQLDSVFAKMVAKRPEVRYRSMAEAIADLERCQTDDASAPSVLLIPEEESRLNAFFAEVNAAGPIGKTPASAARKRSAKPNLWPRPLSKVSVLAVSLGAIITVVITGLTTHDSGPSAPPSVETLDSTQDAPSRNQTSALVNGRNDQQAVADEEPSVPERADQVQQVLSQDRSEQAATVAGDMIPERETMSAEWMTQAPYAGDPLNRPPGTVVIQFGDGYRWLVTDSVLGWEHSIEGDRKIEAARGRSRRYEHVLGTNEVRIIDLKVPPAADVVPNPSHNRDADDDAVTVVERPDPNPEGVPKDPDSILPLAVDSTEGAITINIDEEFQYIPQEFPLGVGTIQASAVGLNKKPFEMLHAEPEYNSTRISYGFIPLGNSDDAKISFAVTISPSDEWLVYLDINNNEDLTDDGQPRQNEGTGRFATAVSLNVDVVTATGEKRTRPYRLWFFITDSDQPRFYAHCHYERQISIDGETYTAAAYETRTSDALYKDDGLWIDLNHDRKLLADTEHFMSGSTVNVAGKKYVLNLDYP